MILKELRAQVLETALLLPKYNLVWMAGGTVCARDPQTGYVVVTPSGLDYERLTPDDMIVTDMDMTLIEGKYRPSVALNLWTGFMRARPGEFTRSSIRTRHMRLRFRLYISPSQSLPRPWRIGSAGLCR
jgi:hypothetical protein